MSLARRLSRIQEALKETSSDLRDMTDDQLVRLITGNSAAESNDITNNQLQAVIARQGRFVKKNQ